MKKKKVILSKDVQHGFVFFSLNISAEDFKVAYLLNKNLGIDLMREADLMVYYDEKSDPVPFSFFLHNRNKQTCYYLIHNLKDHQPLMKQYFLLVNGFFTEADKSSLIATVSKIPEVLAVNQLKENPAHPTKKPSGKAFDLINAIITDLEYHILEINKRSKESKVQLQVTNTHKIKTLY
jgi:hypothetical protein